MREALSLLGVGVRPTDYREASDAIIAAARARRPFGVSALAVHGIMTGVLDQEQRARLNDLDLLVPDGQPVRWALNLLYRAGLADRVYGPTLMLRICEKAAEEQLPIFLYGSRSEVLARLSTQLQARFPALRIAGTEPSRFRRTSAEEKDELVARIVDSGAAVTFVGLGCPRQEVWAYEYRASLRMPVVAVGAAFDFHAGLLPQAPPRLQRAGLEWAFRLSREPYRLWKRYLLLNPLFIAMVAVQATGLWKPRLSLEAAAAPRDLRYG